MYYNIGIRVKHGAFHGVKLVTNHNFVSSEPFKIGQKINLFDWNVIGEVYQVSARYRELLPTDVMLKEVAA